MRIKNKKKGKRKVGYIIHIKLKHLSLATTANNSKLKQGFPNFTERLKLLITDHLQSTLEIEKAGHWQISDEPPESCNS